MRLWNRLLGRERARERWRNAAIREIERRESELRAASDAALKERGRDLRARAGSGDDGVVVAGFALVREVARRTLGLRPYDVQLLGALALHDGCIAEMKTGEGKTLTATLPAVVHAWAGRGVHIVTVNDYLAERDAQWMGPVFEFFDLRVGVILEEMGASEAEELARRRAAYACDITYGTNHEIAFDYLRDNLAGRLEDIVHRGFHYAIVDEVDFLLIDEARTPLIISAPARDDVGDLRRVDGVVRRLQEGLHYTVEAKSRTAGLTEVGYELVARGLHVSDLTAPEHVDLYRAMYRALIAHGVYRCDIDYIVQDDQVVIVDEFTGRLSPDKRYADGLHQAIEVKEGVRVRSEDRTAAKVTYQTFFSRYSRLAGMSGTAWAERDEFRRVYGCEVRVIPTHRPMVRRDLGDIVFDKLADKHEAIVADTLARVQRGQPVLIGTTSVRESEQLSRRLKKAGVEHAVLNAKNHRAEAHIVAQAGRRGAVTVSTNMAGRGTDILLGGNPESLDPSRTAPARDGQGLRHQCELEREQVIGAGGLHVIGSSHNESVRIDEQLRGRAGRQGDPGSSRFFVSLDDDIYKKFGRRAIERIRAELAARGHQTGEQIADRSSKKALVDLQRKVEVENQGIRRELVGYDLVVHSQRETIYGWRRQLVVDGQFGGDDLIRDVVDDLVQQSVDRASLAAALRAHFHGSFGFDDLDDEDDPTDAALAQAIALFQRREDRIGADLVHAHGREILLDTIDELWADHLSNLERLEEWIGLYGHVEVEPLVAWRKEATQMFQELLRTIRSRAVSLWFWVEPGQRAAEMRARPT
jgi:preprotein translocase subunit SecA